MLYFTLMSLDKTDAFKYGYGNDVNNDLHIYKYDDIAATVTVLNEIDELNFTRYIKFNSNYEKFISEFSIAKSDAENNAKYYKIPNQDNNEYFIDFSLLVNHAFQDGLHIGMFINELQDNISNVNLKFKVKEFQNVKTKSKNNF